MQEIYFQDMDLAIKLKCLSPEEAQNIIDKQPDSSKVEYMLLVLGTCVYNLRTEISAALHSMDKSVGDQFLKEIYNGCIMLNPGLDIKTWVKLTQAYDMFAEENMLMFPPALINLDTGEMRFPGNIETFTFDDDDLELEVEKKKPTAPFKLSKAKFLNLKKHLSEKVIGQPEAIEEVYNSLKRSQAGLKDADRPIGIFLFAGPSGTGKTLLAKELHDYMFSSKSEMVRVDCGEFQHKHENQKLIGSANGFVGYEEGGQLTEAIKANPQTVLLLDEVEKAHPDIWGTFLNVFDDGYIIDNKGEKVSFKDVIIIMTSNLGNDKIAAEITSKGTGFASNIDNNYGSKNIPNRKLVTSRTDEAIHKYFKPELLNRIDNTIIFNYLTDKNYLQIADLELLNLAEKLSKLHFNLVWSPPVSKLLVDLSGRTLEGARSILKVRRNEIEDKLADLLLENKYRRGTTFSISVKNGKFNISKGVETDEN